MALGEGGVGRRGKGGEREGKGREGVIVYVHVDHLPFILSSILIHVGLLLCLKHIFLSH